MANGRKVRSSEAVGLLRQWEVSGEFMSTWCEQRDLTERAVVSDAAR